MMENYQIDINNSFARIRIPADYEKKAELESNLQNPLNIEKVIDWHKARGCPSSGDSYPSSRYAYS